MTAGGEAHLCDNRSGEDSNQQTSEDITKEVAAHKAA